MIRHTASSVLKTNAFIQNILADEGNGKTTANKNRKSRVTTDDRLDKASIAALIKIACNASNSTTLRDMACDQLGEKISHTPQYAAFAAGELFARRNSGAPPANVFDALIRVIRESRIAKGGIFGDAVDAISEKEMENRLKAETRVLFALRSNSLLFIKKTRPYFFGSS